jgi:hypothetical protein
MKQFVSKVLMLIAFLSISMSASGYDFEADGIYYRVTSASDFTCAVTNGQQGNVFTGDNLYEGDVIIPAHVDYKNKTLTVTSIDGWAFYKCSQLNTVMIPETVIEIGTGAFEGCTNLTSIDLPNSVTELGSSIFERCTALKNIHLPEDIKHISSHMFSDCTAIESILLPPSVVGIGSSAFMNCSNLGSIDFPDGIEYIDANSFKNCTKISKIKLPYSLITIGDCAFEGLNLIQKLVLPESLEHIGTYAFSNCSELMEIDIVSSTKPLYFNIVRLGETCGTFFGCPKLTNLTLGREVQLYDTYFNSSRYLRTKWIFDGNITTLTIQNNVNFWEVFSEKNFSESLENLTFGTYNFANQIRLYDYSKLKVIAITTSIPPKCPWFSDKQRMDIILKVPNGSLDAYKTTDGWKNFWNIEEMDDSSSGIDNINNNYDISIRTNDGSIAIQNKAESSIVRIYNLQGQLIKETYQSEIPGLPRGVYILSIDNHSFKIAI